MNLFKCFLKLCIKEYENYKKMMDYYETMEGGTMIVKKTERGWGGHFCCAFRCLFRRNTLLEYKDIKIVVSTVGAMFRDKGDLTDFGTVGYRRFYETMVFESNYKDKIYFGANVSNQISFDSKWFIDKIHDESDNEANEMHENVVSEIERKLLNNVISKIEKLK